MSLKSIALVTRPIELYLHPLAGCCSCLDNHKMLCCQPKIKLGVTLADSARGHPMFEVYESKVVSYEFTCCRYMYNLVYLPGYATRLNGFLVN